MIIINDLRPAYLYAQNPASRENELPKNDPDHGNGLVRKLKLCCVMAHVTQPRQETFSAHLESVVFVLGRGRPTVFLHPEIKTFAHGDDYVSAGDDASMTWLEDELSEAYEIKTLKLCMNKDHRQAGQVLNRIA